MEALLILEKLVELFKRQPADRTNTMEIVNSLLADLPPEAVAGPKANMTGWQAEMTGYKAPFVLKAGLERLGAAGWVSVPIYGEAQDTFLTNDAARKNEFDGVFVNVQCVTYFPGLHVGTITDGTGDGKTIADARKAAKTTATKRALAEVGIGWKGYTDQTQRVDPVDMPPTQHPAPEKPKTTSTPAAASAPPAAQKSAQGRPAPQGGTAPAQAGAYNGPPPSTTKAASEAQVGKIGALCGENQIDQAAMEYYLGKALRQLTSAEASAVIGELLRGKHPLQQAAPPSDDPYGGA